MSEKQIGITVTTVLFLGLGGGALWEDSTKRREERLQLEQQQLKKRAEDEAQQRIKAEDDVKILKLNQYVNTLVKYGKGTQDGIDRYLAVHTTCQKIQEVLGPPDQGLNIDSNMLRYSFDSKAAPFRAAAFTCSPSGSLKEISMGGETFDYSRWKTTATITNHEIEYAIPRIGIPRR